MITRCSVVAVVRFGFHASMIHRLLRRFIFCSVLFLGRLENPKA
jgi:hypothetical protein